LIYTNKSFRARAAVLYREEVSGADAFDFGTALSPTILRDIEAQQTLNVSAHFSVASATVEILVGLFKSTTFIGFRKATLTAESDIKSGAKFISPVEFFDLGGADGYEIRMRAPSSGNASLLAWES